MNKKIDANTVTILFCSGVFYFFSIKMFIDTETVMLPISFFVFGSLLLWLGLRHKKLKKDQESKFLAQVNELKGYENGYLNYRGYSIKIQVHVPKGNLGKKYDPNKLIAIFKIKNPSHKLKFQLGKKYDLIKKDDWVRFDLNIILTRRNIKPESIFKELDKAIDFVEKIDPPTTNLQS